MSLIKIRAALETALAGLVLVPDVPLTSVSTLGVVTTPSDHNLQEGTSVTISGNSEPSVNATYLVKPLTSVSFNLLTLTTKQLFKPLTAGNGGVAKANLIAWEGLAFNPVSGLILVRPQLLPANPENPTFGGGHIREIGFFQVNLQWPTRQGTNAIMQRAELIRELFKRGASFTNGGLTVRISGTPQIFDCVVEDEYILSAVRIPYWCDVLS